MHTLRSQQASDEPALLDRFATKNNAIK